MKAADILFEKLVMQSNASNDELITCSEKRRSLLNNIYHKSSDIYTSATDYYNAYVAMLPKLYDAHLKYQPLFQWEHHGSSSWLYEKLHLEHLRMKEAWKKALDVSNLKERRNLFRDSVACGMDALDTLSHFHWEDPSLMRLSFMQDRYYLYHMCKAASQYYKTMNAFSEETNATSNTRCLKYAFEYMDIALLIWKSDIYDEEEWFNVKALYLLDMATQLTDDQCGERCALLQDIVKVKHIPSKVVSEYKLWKQQNEQVYYQKEETNITIDHSSLNDLFLNLSTIVE